MIIVGPLSPWLAPHRVCCVFLACSARPSCHHMVQSPATRSSSRAGRADIAGARPQLPSPDMEPVLTTTQHQDHHLLLLLPIRVMPGTSLGSSCHEVCLPPEVVIKDLIKRSFKEKFFPEMLDSSSDLLGWGKNIFYYTWLLFTSVNSEKYLFSRYLQNGNIN